MYLITNASNFVLTNAVNSMVGNIIATDSGGGGIFGRSYLGTTSYVMNVMRGDITGADIAGMAGITFGGTVVNGILAMNGNILGSSETNLLNRDLGGTVTMDWATSDFGFTLSG